MNLAYLILAHNQPNQLFRLYERLNQENAHFYIHIDSKSPNKDDFYEYFKHKENVKISSDYGIYWMGYNMVAATLSLMSQAVSSGRSYKYFVLLSGQDYPIKNNAYINKFFENNDCDFVDYNKISDLSRNVSLKYRVYHYYDTPYSNPRNSKRIPAVVKGYFYLMKLQDMVLPPRKFYKNLIPYFGPQWIGLTYETTKYILEYVKKEKGYVSYMKYTEGPDETFFQTIICNSPRKTNLYNYEGYLDWEKRRPHKEHFINPLACLEYMDWSERGKPKPAILDASYFEEIKAAPQLFARKVDERESAELMKKIDTDILFNQHENN